MPYPRVGIIIPTLNEESALRRSLRETIGQLRGIDHGQTIDPSPGVHPSHRSDPGSDLGRVDQIVISDGGSRDATTRVAREAGALVVDSPPGRGSQLNRGAAELDTEILLFLHADTTLPRGGVEAVRQAVRDGAVGGGFLVRFNAQPRVLDLGARLINLRTRWTRAPLGDQAQFITRAAYLRLGGFEDWPILEDLDLIRRLRRIGPIAILRGPATTSSRRFLQRGVVRTVATNWLIWILYLLGVSPRRLARLYRQVR